MTYGRPSDAPARRVHHRPGYPRLRLGSVGDDAMKTAVKLALALALSWYLATQAGVTPLDGINVLNNVKDRLKL